VLQIFGTGSGFLRHHPPHNMEPQTKRFARSLKNCSGSDRCLMSACRADQKGTLGCPRPIAMAAWTYKTLGPTQVPYIIVTILLCCKSCSSKPLRGRT
jgi:hypothetical protein